MAEVVKLCTFFGSYGLNDPELDHPQLFFLAVDSRCSQCSLTNSPDRRDQRYTPAASSPSPHDNLGAKLYWQTCLSPTSRILASKPSHWLLGNWREKLSHRGLPLWSVFARRFIGLEVANASSRVAISIILVSARYGIGSTSKHLILLVKLT